MYKRISKISLFFFIVYYNYILLRFLIFPHYYDSYGANGIFIAIGLAIIIALVFLLLPKKFYKTDFHSKYKNSMFKYFYNSLLIIRTILGLSSCSYLLMTLFFPEYPFWLILIGLVLVVAIISRGSSSDIIEISTLFGIVGTTIYILYFYDFINLDFTLINFKFDFNMISILYGIILIFDNFLCFLAKKDRLNLTKAPIVLGILFAMLLFIFEYLILNLTSGDVLFKGNPLSGFKSLAIQPVSRFNGNFKYVYIIVIVIAVIFKFSFFTSFIAENKKISIKYVLGFTVVFALSVLFYMLYKWNDQFAIYIIVISILLSGLVPIWMLKEVYNARLDER